MNQSVDADLDKEKTSFIQRLALYYSEFLATDFKNKGIPKRRYQGRDRKGRRNGISLEKFPTFLPKLNKVLSEKSSQGLSITVKLQDHQANLASVVEAALQSCVKGLDFSGLKDINAKTLGEYKKLIQQKDCDLEVESTNLITRLRNNIGLEIGAPIIRWLQPTFEKSASNLIDTLVSIEEEIAEILITPFEEALSSALADFIRLEDDARLLELMEEVFSDGVIRVKLSEYFEVFKAGDLFTQLRELSAVEQLEDNLEYYLYLGEVKHLAHQFPLFYIPFKMEQEAKAAKFNLTLDPRILVNKKAIDYIARIIQGETNTSGASVIDQRIMHVNPDENILDAANGLMQRILGAFQFDGSIFFGKPKSVLKNVSISVNNSCSFALFDKSDESMLTDYEELLVGLSQEGGGLLTFLDDLVSTFFEENPLNVVNEILDDWDVMEASDRLVFDSPIPLAEEQRKIINALNNPKTRFVTVEGPPGTGKSHTISAIAFGAILKKQSILILSDKKEALDVVEDKLNQTLKKVRPSDDFVNPILRLGKEGANFNKLTTVASIDKLRTQHREIKKNRGARVARYKEAKLALKGSIDNRVEQISKINPIDIFAMENEANAFKAEWLDTPNFIEIFESEGDDFTEELLAIDLLIDLRETCKQFPADFLSLCAEFGDDASSIAYAVTFLNKVLSLDHKTGLFKDAPKITAESLLHIEQKIKEVRREEGFFGYFFAATAMKQMTQDVEELIGLKITQWDKPTTDGNFIISKLAAVQERGNKFFQPLLKEFPEHCHLINQARGVQKLKKSSDLISKLLRLHKYIEDCELPFLGDEETVIEVLTSEESGEADFFETFTRLRKEFLATRENFDIQEYSYLARKTELETYNALELATEIDGRVIHFTDNYKNDVKTLAKIIRNKMKFPREKFEILKEAFPCMICGLRDYAEYIPLEKELFDIVIIDEASQVSIAQAFPAIIRAKKIIVLGDRRQFGNVKTSHASKEMNAAWFGQLKATLLEERDGSESDLLVRVDALNIKSSVLDFMESVANFSIMLKKHFRGYPEMISFSSKYFYGGDLQAMKIRGKSIEQVLEFIAIEHDGDFEPYKNTNHLEAMAILNRVLEQLDESNFQSVAVITPFQHQQAYISKVFSEHQKYQEIRDKLHFRCFTFDSCQGEERDIVYYSMVASPGIDKLWTVLPKSIEAQDEEELDRNLRMQRVNVAFSRGKEKLIFVHSKPITELSAGRDVLIHFSQQIANAKNPPAATSVDSSSKAEEKVLVWIQQSPVCVEFQPEIIPQFELGKYLKSLDSSYSHASYRVDFLLRFTIDGQQRDIIIEYDGFEYHFDSKEEVDAGNWLHYQKSEDIEREHILESYGYKMLRLNKFNIGKDPVHFLNGQIAKILKEYEDKGDALVRTVIDDATSAFEGLNSGTYRICKKCDQNKPATEFMDDNAVSGYRRFCLSCSKPMHKKSKKKVILSDSKSSETKICPNCSQDFPLSEFMDESNKSGKRRLCGACKKISVAREEAWLKAHPEYKK